MKTRSGFVSNSSSSSFIILDKKMTTFQFAAMAMELVQQDWKELDNGKDHPYYEKTMALLKGYQELDIPVFIPWTCNYPTFIYRGSDNRIRVHTCHNHPWQDLDIYIEDMTQDEGFNVPEYALFLNLETLISDTYISLFTGESS